MSDPSTIPWGPDTSWGSYMPPLMAALAQTKGPVLEIGMGNWSTPVLHGYCKAAGRELVSLENNPTWAQPFIAEYASLHHRMQDSYQSLADWADVAPWTPGGFAIRSPNKQANLWSVVFIDNSPGGRRAADAILFVDTAEFIIVHDWSSSEITEPFAPILDRWKYRRVYDRYPPSTMVLSNTRELIL